MQMSNFCGYLFYVKKPFDFCIFSSVTIYSDSNIVFIVPLSIENIHYVEDVRQIFIHKNRFSKHTRDLLICRYQCPQMAANYRTHFNWGNKKKGNGSGKPIWKNWLLTPRDRQPEMYSLRNTVHFFWTQPYDIQWFSRHVFPIHLQICLHGY